MPRVPNLTTRESVLIHDIQEQYGLRTDMLIWRNNTGCARGKRRLVRFGLLGSADFIVLLDGGKTLFVECKRVGKDRDAQQRRFERRVTELGFTYVVAWTMDDFRAALVRMGVVQ